MKTNPDITTKKTAACGLTEDDWIAWLEERGEKKYRAKQILDWIFKKRVTDFEAMTNLTPALRSQLAENFNLEPLTVTRLNGSHDTTRKFLFRLEDDGRLIETVLIPATTSLYGQKSDRLTLCVSSQVGCAFDCKFCASGLAGFTRNLTAGEIVAQVLMAEAESGERVNNLVFMGMGEPLANLKNLTQAIRILNGHWGVNLGARHMTVSTSGLAPMIEKLAEEPVPVRLAISLHGATDEVRSKIMPVNERYNLDRLFKALDVWAEHRKQKITLEYILIEGVNDGLDQAKFLARRAKKIRAKVNLIPYNTVEGLEWSRPAESVQENFYAVLKDAGVPTTLRREKGHDINAACGQLRLQEETASGMIEAVA